MLTLSGFGAVPDEFMDCMAGGGDADVCRELYPQTAEPGLIETPDDYVGRLTPEEQQIAASHACDHCDPNTQWCDGTSCIQFTAAEQAAWASAGKPPAQLVVRASPHKSLLPGISNKTLAIGVLAIGVLGVFAFRRKKQA